MIFSKNMISFTIQCDIIHYCYDIIPFFVILFHVLWYYSLFAHLIEKWKSNKMLLYDSGPTPYLYYMWYSSVILFYRPATKPWIKISQRNNLRHYFNAFTCFLDVCCVLLCNMVIDYWFTALRITLGLEVFEWPLKYASFVYFSDQIIFYT